MPLDSTTAITIPGLPAGTNLWDEEANEEFGRTSSEATRVMRCMWPARVFIAELLRGQSYGFTYTPPQRYPDAPWLFVDKVKTKGYEGTDPTSGLPTGRTVGVNGMVAYKYAALVVTYRTLDYLADQQLGSLALDYGTQWITIPGTGSGGGAVAKFVTTGNDSIEDASVPITVVEFSRTINQVVNLPVTTAMAAAKNPVNSAEFEGADPGYVIFAGLHSSRQIDTYGNERWSITTKYKYRSVPWDQAINPNLPSGSTSPFEQLVYKATGNPIIGRSDLNALLNPNAT